MSKVVLVTGAGDGIGKAIALRLAKDGFDVAVNDLNGETANQTSQEIKELGRNSIAIQADVSDEKQVKSMIDETVNQLGSIDILVNNAGICPVRTIDQVSVDDFKKTLDINLTSIFAASKYASEYMIKQGDGRIINAASQAAYSNNPASIEYTSSKWAIRGMTRVLAQELGRFNIKVNAYCPGKIWTKMQERNAENASKLLGISKEAYIEATKKTIPLGEYQTPEDVAGLVSYLASDDAAMMTGQSIMINGGEHMC